MSQSIVRERRFIVIDYDAQALEAALKTPYGQNGVEFIRQGYFESSPIDHVMIRLIDLIDDHRIAKLTRKRGHGLERTLERREIPFEDGEWLFDACPYRLEKSRYRPEIDLKIDVFEGTLEGLVIAELNAVLPGSLPEWIRETVEVTDSLTNLHLAKLAEELKESGVVFSRMRHLKRIPRIVLTGGPCSGKSSLIRDLRKEFGDVLHSVPEVATIVIGQVGVIPPTREGDGESYRTFQRTIAGVQRLFEGVSSDQAVRDGKSALLLDRGVPDIAAYLPYGMTDLERLLATTRQAEYAEYDLVLCLDLPSRELYEANRANNPSRFETYDEAKAVSLHTESAWAGHPKFRIVRDRPTWAEKRDEAIAIIREFLKSL